MKQIFKKVKPVEMSFLQKLFNQLPTENAIIEFNNLLASHRIQNITSDQVKNIELKYSIVLNTEFNLNMQEFFAVYWNQYLRHEDSNSDSENELNHFIQILNLNTTTTSFLQRKLGEVWYQEVITTSLTSRRFYPDDLLKLERLRQKARLPGPIAEQILNDAKLVVVESYVTTLNSKNQCSPTEEAELDAMMVNFCVPAETIKQIKEKLQKSKYYWELEHLPLKSISVKATLQRNETCFLQMNMVKWYETRSAGHGTKQFELINEGSLYLTNKRLLFEGNKKTSIITFDRIKNISLQTNGITIHKDKGKEPVLAFKSDSYLFDLVLKRLLKESREI